MGKRVCLVLGLLAGLSAPAAPVAGVAGFGDVEPERYYTAPVQWLVDDDIIETDNSACFAPNTTANRGDTGLYIWRMRGQPGAPPHPFEDVTDEDQNKAVSWMYANGITDGKSPSAFAPDDTLTRGEVAAFLHRLSGRPHATGHPFTDVTAPWQQQPVAWMFRNGITTGTGPTTFAPDEPVTRGQLATFLYRYKGEPPVTIDPASPDCNEFTAVAAGDEHSCGLRTDQTIACWGSNNYGESNPPPGRFTAVSAGGGHSCGLRTDNTITCWGDNNSGQSNPPPGRFTAIAAGRQHSCGLRTDNTIACWGDEQHEKTSAPAGQFSAVSAGSFYSCGLRTDNTAACWNRLDAPRGQFVAMDVGGHACGIRSNKSVTCWDANGRTYAPIGHFTAITAGWNHSCGLRTDNTITCWGRNYNDLTNAPQGQFSAVAMSDRHSCGLRTDSTLICWGDGTNGRTYAPSGHFTAITAGWNYSCGLRTNQTAACWGWIGGNAPAPSGTFSALASGLYHSCGLRTDRTITCWGSNHSGESNAPAGQFIAVTAAARYSCGIRTNQTVTCWGDDNSSRADDYSSRADAPGGQFKTISAGDFPCGIRTDDTIACWGPESTYLGANPPRQNAKFSAVSVSRSPQYGGSHACGLRTDKSITCWGSNYFGESNPPIGQFTSVATADALSCGLRTDQTITCWGYRGGSFPYPGQPYEPDGKFTAMTAGGHHSCGIRTDGTLTCWGFALAVPMPNGVRHTTGEGWPNPDDCRPFGGGHLAPGFSQRGTVQTTGTVRVAVLFVDFPDAEAEYSTRHESRESLLYAEQYLEAASYGKLDIEFVPLHRWLRVENYYTDYLGSFNNESESISEAAVRLADPEYDFSGIDVVMTVGPSTHFDGANAGGQVTTNEGILATNRINIPSRSIIFLGDGTLQEWGHAAAHELAHNLGLADLYDASGSRASRTADVAGWPSAEFGLMGFRVLLPPEYGYRFDGGEMLAWNRWLLGWLDPSQIRCVTEPEAIVGLTPVANPGDGTAMAAIPLSGTEVIVVESRRRLGYDSDISHRLPEGVLVYTVDAAVATGALPIKGANETTTEFNTQSPYLTEGQSITVAGYTITLLSDDGETHTVKISRTNTDNVGQGL